MRHLLFFIGLTLFACSPVTFSHENRPCERGECPGGWTCHPQSNLCVRSVEPGCEGDACTCQPLLAELCNGVDDTCDGNIDEGFACSSGITEACELGDGIGVRTCLATTCTYGPCVAPWLQRMRLTFTNNESQPLSDFPLLVTLDSTRIDYSRTAANGADLRFFDSDMTPLAHEIELWDPTGTSYLWVRVPQVDATTTSDFIWLYFDQFAAPGYAASTQVWNNGYAGVWHLQQDVVGTGNTGVYLDSTANGNHGDDEVSATNKAGHVGRGQQFVGTDNIAVATHSSLSPSDAVTLEAWAQPPQTSRYTLPITVAPATPVADFQVEVVLTPATFPYADAHSAGNDLRFFDDAGSALPYWIERWDSSGTSRVWVKALQAGTQNITLLFGDSGATSQSSALNTLEPNGLWRTRWNVTHASPTNTAAMDTLFDRDYEDRVEASSGPQSQVSRTSSNFSENMLNLFEGWYYAPSAGCYVFGVDGDDAVDLHVDGGANWQSYFDPGSKVADYYGSHDISNNFAAHSGSRNLGTGLHRFVFRHEDSGSNEAWFAAVAYGATCPGTPSFSVVPSGSFYYRKRAIPQPMTTLGAQQALAIGITKGDQYALTISGDAIVGTVDGQQVSHASTPTWQHVTLTYDRQMVRLYIDGVERMAVSKTDAVTSNTTAMILGSSTPNFGLLQSSLDEVRVSNTARSAAFLAAQVASMNDTFVTYGTAEAVP